MSTHDTLLLCFFWAASMSLLLHLIKHWRYYYLGSRLPGLSLFGSIQDQIRVLGPLEGMTKRLIAYIGNANVTSKHSFWKFWYGPKLIVIVSNPELTKHIFQVRLRKYSPLYKLVDPYSQGPGIFTENSMSTWKKHRGFITKTSLHFNSVKSFVDIFFQEATILGDKMLPAAQSGEAFEPMQLIRVANLSTTVRTMCGLDLQIQQNFLHQHPFTKAMERGFKIAAVRIVYCHLIFNSLFALLGFKRQQLEDAKQTRLFAEQIISKMKQKLVTQNANEAVDDSEKPSVENESKPVQNFVELIVRDHLGPATPSPKMSHENLITEIITMLTAGSDTTKTTTSLVLIILALHPQVQQEVYKEIQSVLGDDPTTAPSFDQLQELHSLTRVINETLRLYPAAPMLARDVEEEMELDGFKIPKGTGLWIPVFNFHRDPRYWSNPEQFIPERFLPAAEPNLVPYTPFGSGFRNCIGTKYAILQMKTSISSLLRKYRVLPGDKCKSMRDIRIEFGLTIRVLRGNDIRLEPRAK